MLNLEELEFIDELPMPPKPPISFRP